MKKIVAVILVFCLSVTFCGAASKADLYRLSMGKNSSSIELKPFFMSMMFDLTKDKLKEEDFSNTACITAAALMYADALISAKDDADIELDGYIYFAEKKEKSNYGYILVITDDDKTLYITCSDGGDEFFMTETYSKSKSTLKSELENYTDRYESISPFMFVKGMEALAKTLESYT